MPLTMKGQDQDSISKRGGNILLKPLKPNNTPIVVHQKIKNQTGHIPASQ